MRVFGVGPNRRILNLGHLRLGAGFRSPGLEKPKQFRIRLADKLLFGTFSHLAWPAIEKDLRTDIQLARKGNVGAIQRLKAKEIYCLALNFDQVDETARTYHSWREIGPNLFLNEDFPQKALVAALIDSGDLAFEELEKEEFHLKPQQIWQALSYLQSKGFDVSTMSSSQPDKIQLTLKVEQHLFE